MPAHPRPVSEVRPGRCVPFGTDRYRARDSGGDAEGGAEIADQALDGVLQGVGVLVLSPRRRRTGAEPRCPVRCALIVGGIVVSTRSGAGERGMSSSARAVRDGKPFVIPVLLIARERLDDTRGDIFPAPAR